MSYRETVNTATGDPSAPDDDTNTDGSSETGLRAPGRSPRHPRLMLIVLALAIGAGAVAAPAVLSSTNGDNTVAVQAVQRASDYPGPHGEVKAFGVDPGTAKPAFNSALGAVAVAQNDKASCIMRPMSDRCFIAGNVAAGRGFAITNDCSVGSSRAMVVEGFAPSKSSVSRLVYSDGATLDSDVHGGAFLLTTTTPDSGAPYPTEVRFLDADGVVLHAQTIPDGDHLCSPGA